MKTLFVITWYRQSIIECEINEHDGKITERFWREKFGFNKNMHIILYSRYVYKI